MILLLLVSEPTNRLALRLTRCFDLRHTVSVLERVRSVKQLTINLSPLLAPCVTRRENLRDSQVALWCRAIPKHKALVADVRGLLLRQRRWCCRRRRWSWRLHAHQPHRAETFGGELGARRCCWSPARQAGFPTLSPAHRSCTPLLAQPEPEPLLGLARPGRSALCSDHRR